jgi:hypothetical protein
MSPDFGRLIDLLTEPTIGVPLLVTLGLLAAWLLWSPRPLERPPALRRTWFAPSTDAVSLVYYALADERYSVILGTVYERLDRAVERRFHLVIAQLPMFARRDSAVPEAPRLKRAARRIRSAYAEALQRESPYWFRWAFWRSARSDEDQFLARVDDAIRVSADLISNLEGTP